MAEGKYTRRQRKRINPGFIIMIALLLVLLAILIILIHSCIAKFDTPEVPSTVPTEPVITTVQTEPETTEPTEETTQETTEATEETTEATEETTEETTEATEATEETTQATTEPGAPAEPSSLGDAVAALAQAQLGKPFLMGGTGPDEFDASGLIYYCFRENGIDPPRLVSGQSSFGQHVDKENLQPGDVLFFWTENPGEAEYVGIYIGGGKFIAARNSKYPVSEMGLNTDYFTERFVCARRFG